MRRLSLFVARASDAIAIGLTVAVLLLMLAQVVFRYALNQPLVWGDEVVTWGLAWIVMIGSVGVMGQWRHVYMPVVVNLFPMPARIPLILASKLCTILFLALIVAYGAANVAGGFHRTSPLLGLSTRWLKLAIPLGCGLMLLVALQSALDDLRAWRRRDLAHFEAYGGADIEV